MTDTFTSIWIKISLPGIKSFHICGAYREHQYLKQDTDWSLQPGEQATRWKTFLRQVETVSMNSICHLIGDYNLDFLKWSTPDQAHKQMILDAKQTLDAGGFHQLIEGITRAWPGQVDTLIDHFWSNAPHKIIQTKNEIRSVGDHNNISAVIRFKGSDSNRLDVMKKILQEF